MGGPPGSSSSSSRCSARQLPRRAAARRRPRPPRASHMAAPPCRRRAGHGEAGAVAHGGCRPLLRAGPQRADHAAGEARRHPGATTARQLGSQAAEQLSRGCGAARRHTRRWARGGRSRPWLHSACLLCMLWLCVLPLLPRAPGLTSGVPAACAAASNSVGGALQLPLSCCPLVPHCCSARAWSRMWCPLPARMKAARVRWGLGCMLDVGVRSKGWVVIMSWRGTLGVAPASSTPLRASLLRTKRPRPCFPLFCRGRGLH